MSSVAGCKDISCIAVISSMLQEEHDPKLANNNNNMTTSFLEIKITGVNDVIANYRPSVLHHCLQSHCNASGGYMANTWRPVAHAVGYATSSHRPTENC